jgi:predicted DNA-binding protein (UPF0251 family)
VLSSHNRAAMAVLLDSFALLLSRSGACRTFAGLTPEALGAQYRALGEGPGLLTLCALSLALRPRMLGLAKRYSVDPSDIIYKHLALAVAKGAEDPAKHVRRQLDNLEVARRSTAAREESYQSEVLSLQAEPQAETALRTREIAVALGQLSGEERSLCQDIDDGLSQEEMAEARGVSLTTLKRQLRAARGKLSRLLFL